MIRAIVFDCYGVLVTDGWLPFKQEHFGNNSELMQEAGDLSSQHNLGMITTEEFIKRLAIMSDLSPADVISTVYSNKPNVHLFDQISSLKNMYKIGMLSNMADDALHTLFSDQQLDYFNAVALSCEIGFIKPDLRSYKATADMLGVDATECIMIDDLEHNCIAAEDAGMKSIYYRNFEQCKIELEKLLADTEG